jgi:putative FmdB family regulatory protein
MVLREYECPKCGYFEHEHRVSEDSLTECPTCGSECHRVWSEMPTVWWIGWPYMRDADLGPHVHG